MKALIRQGDSLREYGGKVLEGHGCCFGKGIACLGDRVQCHKHGLTTIAEDCNLARIEGKPIALHQQRCACGCTLISSLTCAECGVER